MPSKVVFAYLRIPAELAVTQPDPRLLNETTASPRRRANGAARVLPA
jgi:hypothetical protein